MMTDTIAHRRPTMALSGSTGRPVTAASVVTGMPIDSERHRRSVGEQADAGGVERVEAEAGEHRARHRHRRAEAAAPSMNAPNENAMNIACSRRSSVRLPTESLMTSNLPVSTASR